MAGFSISLNITGISELANQLNLRGQAVEEAKNAAVDKVAQLLQQYVQTNIGGGHPEYPNNMTSTMRQSIMWEHVSDGKARVWTDLDYAYWVEFGHAQEPGRFVPAIQARLVQPSVPAYPFFRPAVTQIFDSGEAQQIITQTLQAAVLNGDGGGGSASAGGFSPIVEGDIAVAEVL